MVSYAIILGEKYKYFLYNRYKFIGNDKTEEGTFLNATNNRLHPHEYRVEKYGRDAFKKLERSLIQTFWPGVEEDREDEVDISDVEDEFEEDEDLIETHYLNGNNEVVKIFNQKCVVCLERKSISAFRQCGHQ